MPALVGAHHLSSSQVRPLSDKETNFTLFCELTSAKHGTILKRRKVLDCRIIHWRWCQSKTNQSPIVPMQQVTSSEKFAPLEWGGVTLCSERWSTVDVAVQVEVIVKRGMYRNELLQIRHPTKTRHGAFSSSKR